MERFENEIWEPVIGFEGHYEVSNYGRVKALRRTIYRNDGRVRTMKEKILQLLDSHGYKSVMLCKEGKGKSQPEIINSIFKGPCVKSRVLLLI